MLVAKITPPAKKVIEVSPFSSTTEELNYMTAIARPYVPGSESTNFQVQFGSLNSNENTRFSSQLNSQLNLTSEELSNWGTNDEVLLEIIANKLGVDVIEIIEVSQRQF
jgi:hypothetical protein